MTIQADLGEIYGFHGFPEGKAALTSFLHHKICQQDALTFDLLFPDHAVAPFFKEGFGGNGGVGGDTIGTHRLFQCVTEGRSYASPLVILMHIQPVQVAIRFYIPKADDLPCLDGYHTKTVRKGVSPFFHISFSGAHAASWGSV